VTTTDCAGFVDEPFEIVNVSVTFEPVVTGSGDAEAIIDRSADGGLFAWPLAVAELFALFGSAVEDDTLAGFDSVPAEFAVRTTATFAEPFAGMFPRLHVIVPAETEHEPCDGVALTYEAPAGTASVKTTDWAGFADEPFEIVKVSVRFEPTITGFGAADALIDRSADGGLFTVEVAVAVLFAEFGSGEVALTLAGLDSVPAVVGVRTTATVAVPLAGMFPRLHVIVPAEIEHEPCDGVALT